MMAWSPALPWAETNTAIENNAADKEQAVRAAVSSIDRAVSKGLLHKNTAARKKSALVRKAAVWL